MTPKNTKTALLLAATALAAGAAFAQLRTGVYQSEKTAALPRTTQTTLSPDAVYDAGGFASAPADLAPGEGLAETQSFCAICHSTRYITMQPPLPAATWEAVVNKMVKTFGAPIPEASEKKIKAYLQAHYTPENRKQ